MVNPTTLFLIAVCGSKSLGIEFQAIVQITKKFRTAHKKARDNQLQAMILRLTVVQQLARPLARRRER
jgi:hypothetical protein